MTSRLNKPDTAADISVRDCLDSQPQRSFIMIAGAGSGKTTSLVKALYHVLNTKRKTFKKLGQKVACITYTEIAAGEIWGDVGNDPQAQVSTIHSFLWNIIAPFQKDIKDWVCSRIDQKIADLQADALAFTTRTRATTREKNAQSQAKLIVTKGTINDVPRFVYGTGSNYPRGILGHDDILRIVPDLLPLRPLLKTIISQRFPVVFVDESQDTTPAIVAFLKEIATAPNCCVGFFGDPMQKIYLTGAGAITLEPGWQQITKPENFRCPLTVRNVINKIRAKDDGLEQIEGKEGTPLGTAKIFVLVAGHDRDEKLAHVRKYMAMTTGDDQWLTSNSKTLVIVHRMAATRLGFPALYAALNDKAPSELKDGLTDGSSWPLKPFLQFILPLVDMVISKNEFGVMGILRQYCPLLTDQTLTSARVQELLPILKTNVLELASMFESNKETSVGSVLDYVRSNNLYTFDTRFDPFLDPNPALPVLEAEADIEADSEALQNSISRLFAVPAKEFFGYRTYIQDESTFATQQGVKGTEYERVMSILDDEEGNYNLFSYDKLFGIKELSDSDNQNIEEGNDYSVPRTRRLFYVSCSRATKHLAVVYFVSNEANAVAKIQEADIFNTEDVLTHADLSAL